MQWLLRFSVLFYLWIICDIGNKILQLFSSHVFTYKIQLPILEMQGSEWLKVQTILSVSWDWICILVSDFLGQVVRRIYKGIPASVRGLVWARILTINKTREEQAGVYMVNRGNDSVISSCLKFVKNKVLSQVSRSG